MGEKVVIVACFVTWGGSFRFTLIRGVTLCGGAFPLLHRLWSLATEDPCPGLAQTGRGTLLSGNGTLLMSTAHQPSPVVMGTAVPAGCF